MALRANVSGTTVSRVLGGNADESVSPAARARVLQAARDLGYSPNAAAQTLRSGRSGLIGFWMCLEYSRYRSQVLDRMRGILGRTEYALAVTDVDEEYAWHHSFARALRVPVEGIIAFDASIAATAFTQESDVLAPTLPFVSMGAFWSEAKSYVGIDLKGGVEDAMAHLLASGRRRIAYVVPAGTPFVDSGARFEGYRAALRGARLEPRTIEVLDVPETRGRAIEEELRALQVAGRLPDALLCFYDEMAADVVLAVERLGLTPGREIAVVGINGTEWIDRGPFPITTVAQPIDRMCALAYEYLTAQIVDPRAPVGQTILRPELIVRASSGG